MKISITALALVAAVANAQTLPNIPSCALSCFVTALSSDGCSSLTDFACHCAKTTLIGTITPCVQKACDAADQATVLQDVQSTCQSAGVPISIPASITASVSASSSSSAAPTTSAPSSSAAASSSAMESSAVPTSSYMATSSGNSTATYTTSTPAAFTGAAAPLSQGSVGGLFAVAAALLAAF